jgi:hypothetical protein
MSLRAHLTPTLVAVAVTSALVGGGTATAVTLINGHNIASHTVDLWKLTPAAQSYLRGPGVLGTVPSKRTLTGDFMVTLPYQSLATGEGLVSFQQPFSTTLAASWVTSGRPTTDCPGTVAAPTALPGHFCAYVSYSIGTLGSIVDAAPPPGSTPPNNHTGTRGAILVTHASSSETFAQGSWAATAP